MRALGASSSSQQSLSSVLASPDPPKTSIPSLPVPVQPQREAEWWRRGGGRFPAETSRSH